MESALRTVETVLGLVVLATVVATFARRIEVPAPSLLVVAGLAVALIPGTPDIVVTPELVGLVVLPPLLYAAGEELSWRELRLVWRPVALLAIGLVITSAAAVGAVTVWLTPLPASLAFVLGAVLASTDPVAVAALGRRLSLPPRLQTLVQAESLFNDATSFLLFRLSLGFALAGAIAWGDAAGDFVLLAVGGTAIGALVAAGVALIRWRTEDPVLESVVALVTPYLAYVLAEAVHASGVTAVVVASVILGALRTRLTGPRTRLQLTAVYPTVIFLLESVVFSLIGLQLPALVRRLASADQPWILAALAIAVTLVVVRVAWVLPIARIVARGRSLQVTAVVAWAGTRGVVPLAAVLSVPLADAAGAPLAGRDLVLVLAIAVIALSLVVQGFTLTALVGRSGLAVPAGVAEDEVRAARSAIDREGLAYLDEIAGEVPPAVVDRIRRQLAHTDDVAGEEEPGYRQLWRDVIAVRSAALARRYAEHQVSEAAFHQLQRQLDLEDARFDDR